MADISIHYKYANICIQAYIVMKKTSASDRTQELAEVLRVMAHPKRLELLLFLEMNEKNHFCVTEISDHLKISQPEASRQLSLMKNVRILQSRKDKSSTLYFLNRDNKMIECLLDCLKKNNL